MFQLNRRKLSTDDRWKWTEERHGQNGSKYTTSMGGTQTSGGISNNPTNGATNGSFGIGGNATHHAGAGGGGWYGGAGGHAHYPGGGGSGYIGGVSNGSMQNGVRSGNGQATITLVE